MRRFPFLLICFLWGSQVLGQDLPNIIYIYADDLGYGELGCYGQKKIRTPNIDRLATEGIRFTRHYTGAPVCAPARCMLMTGKHAGHSYIRGNYELGGFADSTEGGQMPLPSEVVTVPEMMKQAGFVTGAIGKWGLGMSYNTGDPNKQGFDYFYGYLDQKQAHNHYPTHLWENGKWDTLRNQPFHPHQRIPPGSRDEAFTHFSGKDHALEKMGEKAVQFLKANRQRPFFLYLPFTSPHLALQAPPEMVQPYQAMFNDQPYHGQNGYVPSRYPRATYAAMISLMDLQVGRVLDALKELGLEENTIVMFSSDNGPTFDVGGADTEFFASSGGLRGRKQDVYEGGIREPLLARWPGKIKPGSVSDHLSAQFDLMATLAEIAGVRAPENDGISFLPTLLGKPQPKHPYLYFEFPEAGGKLAICMGKWKGVKKDMRKNPNAQWEIYDLENDPAEKYDLAAGNAGLAKQFDEIAAREHTCPHIREWEFVDPKIAEK